MRQVVLKLNNVNNLNTDRFIDGVLINLWRLWIYERPFMMVCKIVQVTTHCLLTAEESESENMV